MIKRGTKNIARVHAKNFIHQQADKRLQECVAPYQQQGLNALGVDSFEVELYQKGISSTVCSCKETKVSKEDFNSTPSLLVNSVNPRSGSDNEIVINLNRSLFGAPGEYDEVDDYRDAADDFDLVDDDSEFSVPNLFMSSANCGICYRSGFVPGYTLYGSDRRVYTPIDTVDTYGYTTDKSKAPHLVLQLDPSGYLEFLIEVPKYFNSVSLSIRNNHDQVSSIIYGQDGTKLSLADFKQNAGKTLAVRLTAEEFTHFILVFDLGIPKIRANIAQMSKSLDYSTLDTLGNMNVILPYSIAEVNSTDFICVLSRNQVLKVTDTPFLRTSQDKTLDWAVNTRIIQPQESAKSINKRIFL